jgi:two-component system LytT family response regulator
MRAIIIEDMPLARASLKKDLATFCPDIELVGEAEGVLSGLKLIKSKTPELIFLDVDLSDGTAFELLDLLENLSSKIIFTTASDQHAIRAFEVSAIDYLLKPIEVERLIEAVQKATKVRPSTKEQLELLKSNLKEESRSKIALHTLDQIHIVAFDDIYRLEAQGNYCMIYLADQSKLLVSKTLKEYDRILSEVGFFRTHQSHLVNLKYVKSFVKTEGGYLMLKDKSRIPVAVRKRSALFFKLEEL